MDVAPVTRQARRGMTCTCVDVVTAGRRRPSGPMMGEFRRPAAARCVGETAQGAFGATGAGAGAGGAFGAGVVTFAATGRGAGAAVGASAIGTGTGLATATAGGGVILGTVNTLPAKAGVPRAARPSTPTADSAVRRRNRPVILRSFQRSVSPERIRADQPGSAMTRARPVWRPRVGKSIVCILGISPRCRETFGNHSRFVERVAMRRRSRLTIDERQRDGEMPVPARWESARCLRTRVRIESWNLGAEAESKRLLPFGNKRRATPYLICMLTASATAVGHGSF